MCPPRGFFFAYDSLPSASRWATLFRPSGAFSAGLIVISAPYRGLQLIFRPFRGLGHCMTISSGHVPDETSGLPRPASCGAYRADARDDLSYNVSLIFLGA